MVVFFENTHPKRRALMQMYIVVPITKRENTKVTIQKVHLGLLITCS